MLVLPCPTVTDVSERAHVENPASPLAGYLEGLRPFRVRATHQGGTRGLFQGFVESIRHDPAIDVQESYIESVDGFEWFEHTHPVVASTGPTTVGAAIGAILDSIEWLPRDLDTGRALPDFSADGTKTTMELIGDLMAFDLGAVYPGPNGEIVYRDFNSRWVAKPVDAVIADADLGAYQPEVDAAAIVNRQTVTREGGVPQTAVDEESRRKFGYRDGAPITSAYLASDEAAYDMALFLASITAQGRTKVHRVRLSSICGDEAIAHILDRRIGDRCTFGSNPGITGIIEGVNYRIDPAFGIEAEYTVFVRPATVFTLEISELGGRDILGH